MTQGLVDLDELVLRCRDDKARTYVTEAVACYRAGAYRASIVASWIAVVFDILSKLNELELTGDQNAAAHIKKFEEIRAGGEARLADALAFERNILLIAEKDFEFVTPLEKEELGRLQQDRNKCAHPSMQSKTEPYQPTAETARAHLRNAVEIMLAQEPVQGKAALARLFDEVRSEYFPDSPDAALTHFKRGPLARAKYSLIRNFMIGIAKGYFDESKPLAEGRRLRAAFGAALEMHRQSGEKIVRDDIVPLFRKTSDDHLWRIIAFTCKLPVVWDALTPEIQGKIRTYLSTAALTDPLFVGALAAATAMADLREIAVDRILKLPKAEFAAVAANRPQEVFCDRIVADFRDIYGFRSAEEFASTVVVPHARYMSSGQVKGLIEAIKLNSQIYGAGGSQESICEFFEGVSRHHATTKGDWQDLMRHIDELDTRDALGVTHKYSQLKSKMQQADMWPP